MVIAFWTSICLLIALAAFYAVRPDRRKLLGVVALSLATCVAMLAEAVAAAWEARHAVAPADRATILAAGISEALNCFALWLLLMIPVAVLLLVGLRRRKRMAASS